MVRIIKKRTLFFLGVIITSVLGSVSSFIHTNYSQSGSLLATKAFADVAAAPAVTGSTVVVSDPITGSGVVFDGGGDSGGGSGGGCSDGCY